MMCSFPTEYPVGSYIFGAYPALALYPIIDHSSSVHYCLGWSFNNSQIRDNQGK